MGRRAARPRRATRRNSNASTGTQETLERAYVRAVSGSPDVRSASHALKMKQQNTNATRDTIDSYQDKDLFRDQDINDFFGQRVIARVREGLGLEDLNLEASEENGRRRAPSNAA